MTTISEPTACPGMEGLPDEALVRVAVYFQSLSEPTRLQILELLRRKERNVGELARLCGCSSANMSRHLALLTQHGLVGRETRGNSVYYRVADPMIHKLCDMVCGNIARQFERTARDRAPFAPPVVRRSRAR